jgi:hypothetical protein
MVWKRAELEVPREWEMVVFTTDTETFAGFRSVGSYQVVGFDYERGAAVWKHIKAEAVRRWAYVSEIKPEDV